MALLLFERASGGRVRGRHGWTCCRIPWPSSDVLRLGTGDLQTLFIANLRVERAFGMTSMQRYRHPCGSAVQGRVKVCVFSRTFTCEYKAGCPLLRSCFLLPTCSTTTAGANRVSLRTGDTRSRHVARPRRATFDFHGPEPSEPCRITGLAHNVHDQVGVSTSFGYCQRVA